MKKYYPAGDLKDGFNVYGYSVAQSLVQVLKQCGDNLTRDNVMKQAASLSMELPMLLPGINVKTGSDDFYPDRARAAAALHRHDLGAVRQGVRRLKRCIAAYRALAAASAFFLPSASPAGVFLLLAVCEVDPWPKRNGASASWAIARSPPKR